MDIPMVTVIITVYNGEDFVADAVCSLSAQTIDNIEIFVINDGSTDNTARILDGIDDPRLRVLHLPRTGRAASLAIACRESRGRYIANLDADDISYPQRLEKQAAFLDAHRDYGWIGCAEEQQDDRRQEHHYRVYPLEDDAIRRQAAKCIPYCHSGIMFRRELIDAGINYDPAQPYLIDFEFFIRVAVHWKVANLPDVLVRRHVRSVSYFQSQFKTSAQNARLSRLCIRATRAFRLPSYYYVYPAARLIYPLVPLFLKRLIRRSQGLAETNV